MRTLPKTLKVMGLFWIALTMLVSGMSGVVVCIGAVEAAHERHCESEGDSPEHSSRTCSDFPSNAREECCEDCSDVPVSSDSVLHLTSTLRRWDPVNTPLPPHQKTVWDAHTQMNLGVNSPLAARTLPPWISASLLVQRTVVLRT